MSKPRLFVLLSLAVVSACGDDLPAAELPDAAPPTPDAPPPLVCAPAGYPAALRPQSVDLTAPFTLTLDGVGARCDQLMRALTDPDPANRPPELAELDVVGVTTTCSHNADDGIDVVRFAGPQFAGLPLFAPIQDGVVWVDATNTLVHLHADFLPDSAPAVPPACQPPEVVPASLHGTQLAYARFDKCQPQGVGSYTITPDDVVDVDLEGYALDNDRQLRRVRSVYVYVAPENVTPELVNSELYCCLGESLDQCVGTRLLVDALTGEVVMQQPLCHAC